MAEEQRPGRRDDGRRSGGRSGDDRRRGQRGEGRPRRDGEKRPFQSRDRRESGGQRREGGYQRREGGYQRRNDDRRGSGPRERRPHSDRGGRDREFDGPDLRSVRDEFTPPGIPDDCTADELDQVVFMQLKTLDKDNADRVARHLAMTARLIDDEPEQALQHAIAASRTAGRIGVVRETLGIAAYVNGDFALALRELRTHRRLTGSNDQLPLMVDSERGLERPDRALELARSVEAASLEPAVRVELAIAKSGARLDLGQLQEALEELRIPELDRTKAFDYSPALFAAYANVLQDLGQDAEADEWYALSDRAVDALQSAYESRGSEETVAIDIEYLPREAAEEVSETEEDQ